MYLYGMHVCILIKSFKYRYIAFYPAEFRSIAHELNFNPGYDDLYQTCLIQNMLVYMMYWSILLPYLIKYEI